MPRLFPAGGRGLRRSRGLAPGVRMTRLQARRPQATRRRKDLASGSNRRRPRRARVRVSCEATRGRRSGPWCEAGVVTGCCGRWGRVTGVLRRGREEPRASPAENWRRRCARLWRWGAASPHPALLRETPWEGARRLLRRASGPAPHGHVTVTSRRLGDTCVGPTHKTPSGTSGSRPASALAVTGVADTSVSGD